MRESKTIAQANAMFDKGDLRHNSITSRLNNQGFDIVQRYNAAWYGTLLDNRDFKRKDNGKTTRGWWTKVIYGKLNSYINGSLNTRNNLVLQSKRTVNSTIDVNVSDRRIRG